jgi:hypothetical protein
LIDEFFSITGNFITVDKDMSGDKDGKDTIQ